VLITNASPYDLKLWQHQHGPEQIFYPILRWNRPE